jgi:hypothetical protein
MSSKQRCITRSFSLTNATQELSNQQSTKTLITIQKIVKANTTQKLSSQQPMKAFITTQKPIKKH